MKELVIGRNAYDMIMHYVNKTDFEVSGLGVVNLIDGIPTVTKVYLLKQVNSPSETELDADSINEVLFRHHQSGDDGEIKFWWHSHVNMDVFWSSTDHKAIEQLTENGWFYHAVFNKKNEVRVALSNNNPVFTMVDNLDLVIDENFVPSEILELHLQIDELMNAQKKIWDEDFDKLVTERQFATSTSIGLGKNYYQTGYNHYDMYSNYDKYDASSDEDDLTGGNYTNFIAEGRKELAEYGFDIDQINTLGQYGIYDEEDYLDYVNTFGNLDWIFDEVNKDNIL